MVTQRVSARHDLFRSAGSPWWVGAARILPARSAIRARGKNQRWKWKQTWMFGLPTWKGDRARLGSFGASQWSTLRKTRRRVCKEAETRRRSQKSNFIDDYVCQPVCAWNCASSILYLFSIIIRMKKRKKLHGDQWCHSTCLDWYLRKW